MKPVLFTTYMIRFRRLSTLQIPRVLNRSVEINALRLSATPLFTLRPLYIRNELTISFLQLLIAPMNLLNSGMFARTKSRIRSSKSFGAVPYEAVALNTMKRSLRCHAISSSGKNHGEKLSMVDIAIKFLIELGFIIEIDCTVKK